MFDLLTRNSAIILAAVVRVRKIDIWYGIVAGLIFILGFTRAIFAAKGRLYYEHNVFFRAKITTFVLIAPISIVPTLRYIRWQRAGITPGAPEIAGVRTLLVTQIVLFVGLPILAAAMARGYGERALQLRYQSFIRKDLRRRREREGRNRENQDYS